MLASLFTPLDNSHIFNIKILLQSFGNIIVSNFQLRICYLLEIYSLMASNINILFFLLNLYIILITLLLEVFVDLKGKKEKEKYTNDFFG